MGICPNYDTVVHIVFSILHFPQEPLFLLFVILQVYLLALHFTPRFHSEKRGGVLDIPLLVTGIPDTHFTGLTDSLTRPD